MEIINRIRLKIGGMSYTISTPEPEDYVLGLADGINASLNALLAKNSTLSLNDALVLCLLDSLDSQKREKQNADHIREQLTGYLEDAAKSRIEAGELRSEVSRLKRELSLLRKSEQAIKAEG